jgi:hypothetical protein
MTQFTPVYLKDYKQILTFKCHLKFKWMNFLSCKLFYYRFLETEPVLIELYVSNGAEATKIGTAELSLNDLVV